MNRRGPRCALIAALIVLLGFAAPAGAVEGFLERAGPLSDAYVYPYSDGTEYTDEEAEDPWDLYTYPKKPDETRWELWGPFSLLAATPARRILVFGPSYRNQEFRTEVGGAVAYVSSVFPRHPFSVSVENTWSRLKRVPSADRNFRRIRVATNVQLWRRSGTYEGTALSFTGFFQNQNLTFRTWESGLAITQVIGKRLSISADGIWRRRYLVGGPVLDGAVGIFGGSYNLGAGVRVGGFYELYNQVDRDQDWGGFLSYQVLPFAELIVDAGKFEFVRVRILISRVLDRGY